MAVGLVWADVALGPGFMDDKSLICSNCGRVSLRKFPQAITYNKVEGEKTGRPHN